MNVNDRQVRYIWVAYGANIAVCWEAADNADREVTYETVGTVIYGELRADVLHGFPLRKITAPMPYTNPCIVSEAGPFPLLSATGPTPHNDFRTVRPGAPSHADIARAWDNHTPTEPLDVDPTARRVNESKAQFYQRIANAYQHYAATTGKPTLTIAQEAHVGKSTAGRWIADARLLGYLPDTTRGKIR